MLGSSSITQFSYWNQFDLQTNACVTSDSARGLNLSRNTWARVELTKQKSNNKSVYIFLLTNACLGPNGSSPDSLAEWLFFHGGITWALGAHQGSHHGWPGFVTDWEKWGSSITPQTKEKGDVSLQNSKRQQPQSINSCTARFLASQSLGGDFK